MAEELTIELPVKKPPFWRTRRGLVVLAAIACVVLAGIFSWWLASGTVSSVSGRVDTLIYTVEPDFAAKVNNIYVSEGDAVKAGQPLGSLDVTFMGGQYGDAAREMASLRGMTGISERLGAAQAAERQLAARVAQARAEEDRLKRIYQDAVTDHVRAQLAMRSLDRRNHGMWQQASALEAQARSTMESANAAFEQASRARAAMDLELNKIRAQLMKSGAGKGAFTSDTQAVASVPVQISDLYAPVDGKIMRINVTPGQTIQKGDAAFMIVPTGENYTTQCWIEAWFPLEDQKIIKIGQQALIKFENGMQMEGLVDSIAAPVTPEGKKDAKYVPVKIVPNDAAAMKNIAPGSKVSCQIQTHYLLGYTFFN